MTAASLQSPLLSSNSSPKNLIGLAFPWECHFGMLFQRPMDRAHSLEETLRSTGHETQQVMSFPSCSDFTVLQFILQAALEIGTIISHAYSLE